MQLSKDQQEAAEAFLLFLTHPTEKVMVLGGPSGSGKSFLVKHLLELAQNHIDLLQTLTSKELELNFAMTASTNKAARVIGEATNHAACTIHSYLNITVVNDYRTGKSTLKQGRDYAVKENTLIVIDEASMIDNLLKDMILKSACNCKILFVGDPFQLMPVFEKESPVFSGEYKSHILTTIQRQAAGNTIRDLGEKLRETVETGKFFPLVADNQNVFKITGSEFKDLVEATFTKDMEHNHAKILCWSNSAVNDYNAHVRSLLTTSEAPEPDEYLVSNGIVKSFNSGNIAIGNDQEIRILSWEDATFQNNIDCWLITTTEGTSVLMPKDPKLVDSFIKKYQKEKNWPMYFAFKEQLADLRPVYASTVHKAQGSTYDTVFIDLNDIGRCNIATDVARLLYVAVTRASNRVYLYGELPAKYGG